MTFELYEPAEHDNEPPTDFDTAELYEERCELDSTDPDAEPGETCGGRLVSTGGNGYYNGSYQCYTLYLRCENCGDYEVECV